MRIVFENVTLSFGDRKLFDGLSLEMSGGTITAVVGANGSGKSTFLKLAGQFIRPDAGSSRAFDGERELNRAEFRKRTAATAPTMRLYERLTAEENLLFFSKLRGAAIDDVDAIFKRVGLSSVDRRKLVGEFSTGMVRRLKFAILLTVDADVWLLDEPGANLDDAGKAIVISEILRAAGEGKLILLATNDPNEAAISERVIRL